MNRADPLILPPPDPSCPRCRGRGYTSAPYVMGLRDGDLYTHTICACVTRRKEGWHDV